MPAFFRMLAISRSIIATSLALVAACFAAIPARAVTIDWVTVGNTGNAADTTGYGAVNYQYDIGKYAVTTGNYTAFLNSVAASDPYGLYNTDMGFNMITRSGTSGAYSYSVSTTQGSATNRPVGYVSWFDAARFANWMTNGQPTGPQGAGTTETGGYTLNGAMTGTAPGRNAVTAYFVPSENEWYKAAFFSPVKGGTGGYYLYATQSDSAPGNVVGSSPNQANYYNGVFSTTQSGAFNLGSQYQTNVGAFTNSASYYGTFDQSGNSYQWNDLDGTANVDRGIRGGYWKSGWPGPPVAIPATELTSAVRYQGAADFNSASAYTFGLVQVTAVPEPSTYAMALAGLACGGFSMWRRRGNRRRTKSEMNSARNRCQLMCLTRVALSIIAAGVASTTSAAVIVWGTPQTITGDSDVNTSGSLVYAYNVGPSPTVSSTVTVGGVAFQPFPIINFPATNSFTFGSVTISESPGNLFGYDVASTSGSYGLLSPAYRALLDGGGGAGLPDTVTVSLGGLSLGQQYLFQWWASNAADISFVSTVTGVATNSVTLDSNLTNAAGGLGQFVTGTFTADGATQNITFTGAANSPLINAFQIRAVPEPSTCIMALAGLACGGFSMWRRRKRA